MSNKKTFRVLPYTFRGNSLESKDRNIQEPLRIGDRLEINREKRVKGSFITSTGILIDLVNGFITQIRTLNN